MPTSRPDELHSALEDPTACPEKVSLVAAYFHATSNYQRSVATLNRFIGTIQKAEYENIREWTEKARTDADSARLALEAHIAEHGC
jgi:hypothetical protein